MQLRKKTKPREKRLNTPSHKKFFKTTYFIARKNWEVRENFPDIIDFLKDIGDEGSLKHLVKCTSRSSYVSKTSCNEFPSSLSDYLESKMKNRLIAAEHFSRLTNESTDISNGAEVSIFIQYIGSDTMISKKTFQG